MEGRGGAISASGIGRRDFLGGSALSVAAPMVLGAAAEARTAAAPPARKMAITLTVNGRAHALRIDLRTTLLDALREHIGLTGSKKGCDHGQCGACTVHLDGERVLGRLTLAAQAEGHKITTIEGLADGDRLHPMQAAFVEHDALQCGYCTPVQIMSAVACVREGHAGSEREIAEYKSGNLCRCAAYPNIVAAIVSAAPAIGRA